MCNTLQHTAIDFNALQCTATHYNTLQQARHQDAPRNVQRRVCVSQNCTWTNTPYVHNIDLKFRVCLSQSYMNKYYICTQCWLNISQTARLPKRGIQQNNTQHCQTKQILNVHTIPHSHTSEHMYYAYTMLTKHLSNNTACQAWHRAKQHTTLPNTTHMGWLHVVGSSKL